LVKYKISIIKTLI